MLGTPTPEEEKLNQFVCVGSMTPGICDQVIGFDSGRRFRPINPSAFRRGTKVRFYLYIGGKELGFGSIVKVDGKFVEIDSPIPHEFRKGGIVIVEPENTIPTEKWDNLK